VFAASFAHADAPTGSVKGTVLFEGEPPERAKQDRVGDPKCTQDVLDDAIVVTKGKLAGVLVRVQNGTAGKHAAPAQPIVIDQRDCAYTPRVVGIVAGQQVAVRNSDATHHSVWGKLAGKDLVNTMQAPKAPDVKIDPSAAKPGDVVELACGVHAWMHGYVVVHDHPFFAVTGSDGAFEIKGLPQGKYTLEAWHPVLGTKTLQIEIGKLKRANVTARFSYKASER
jgi:plastocyanin